MLSRLRLFSKLLLCSLLFVGWSAQANQAPKPELPPGIQQLSSVEGVTEYTLDNGLRVLLAPDTSKASVTVNMTYLVGSRHENYGETGMAHLLEHMLFRGTPKLQNALGEFSKRGLQANGTTSNDRTNYYASFAADQDTLDWYLDWQADVMVNAMISREDLDAEMTVVRNEMEQSENNPFRILMQQMLATSYQWHNYGKSVIGARSDVENVDIEQLRAFYRLYYQPDNAVLIVSGSFDTQATLDTIQKAFSPIPRPTRSLPAEYTIEPVQDGERSVTLRRAGGSPVIAAIYHTPAASSADYVDFELGSSILADTPSGILYRNLVDSELSTGVFGYTADLNQPGYVLFGAQLEPEQNLDKALDTLKSTLDNLGPDAFNENDLNRMRQKWLTGWNKTYSDSARLADSLSEASAAGDWRLFFLQRDRVEAARLDDVRTAVKRYLVPDNRTIGRYIPTEKPVRAPAVAAVDLDVLLKDYQGKGPGDVIDAFDASPENINAQTKRDTLKLPNGDVQLALLPKPSRGNRVEANLLMRSGDVDTLKGKQTLASATAALLESGTSTMTRQQIQDKYTELEASVGIGNAGGSVAVQLSTTRDNLPELINLVLHILHDANFPAEELAKYQREVYSSINDAKAEPASLASQALARHDNPWSRDDIRYRPTFDELLEDTAALTRKDIAAFHKQFYGAGSILFTAVGDFDPESVKAALTTGLKDWTQAPAYTRPTNPFRKVKPEQFTIATPDKANAFYIAEQAVSLQDTDPDYVALTVANYLFGGSETSRLWNRVRVQDGLSYTVRSELDASSYEPSGDWTIYAIHAPENSAKLTAAIEEEQKKLLRDGYTDAEVKEAVTAMLNYRKLSRSRDSILARTWMAYLQLNRDFTWSANVDKTLGELTAEKVNSALKSSMLPEQFSSALAADPGKGTVEKSD
jgi:zinc protease